MTRQIGSILVCLLLLSLSGCSWFENDDIDPIFENLPTGTDARVLIKQLPEGLPGDTENSRHMSTTLAPPELVASPDPEK